MMFSSRAAHVDSGPGGPVRLDVDVTKLLVVKNEMEDLWQHTAIATHGNNIRGEQTCLSIRSARTSVIEEEEARWWAAPPVKLRT